MTQSVLLGNFLAHRPSCWAPGLQGYFLTSLLILTNPTGLNVTMVKSQRDKSSTVSIADRRRNVVSLVSTTRQVRTSILYRYGMSSTFSSQSARCPQQINSLNVCQLKLTFKLSNVPVSRSMLKQRLWKRASSEPGRISNFINHSTARTINS